MGHVEDSLVSSPLKNRRRNDKQLDVLRERDEDKKRTGGQMLNASGNIIAICCSSVQTALSFRYES